MNLINNTVYVAMPLRYIDERFTVELR